MNSLTELRMNNQKWSPPEDLLVLQARECYGRGSWGTIAKLIPGRTPLACHIRWRRLLHKQQQEREREKRNYFVAANDNENPRRWNQLPIIPFMMICSYMNIDQAFWAIPQVCEFHLYTLLTYLVVFKIFFSKYLIREELVRFPYRKYFRRFRR